MSNTSLFVPDAISAALRDNLAAGLRELADALDARDLDGKLISAVPGAGGRYDDRLHLRVLLDIAGPVVQALSPPASTWKLDDKS